MRLWLHRQTLLVRLVHAVGITVGYILNEGATFVFMSLFDCHCFIKMHVFTIILQCSDIQCNLLWYDLSSLIPIVTTYALS